jgi:hypothetical protein
MLTWDHWKFQLLKATWHESQELDFVLCLWQQVHFSKRVIAQSREAWFWFSNESYDSWISCGTKNAFASSYNVIWQVLRFWHHAGKFWNRHTSRCRPTYLLWRNAMGTYLIILHVFFGKIWRPTVLDTLINPDMYIFGQHWNLELPEQNVLSWACIHWPGMWQLLPCIYWLIYTCNLHSNLYT